VFGDVGEIDEGTVGDLAFGACQQEQPIDQPLVAQVYLQHRLAEFADLG